MLGRSKNVPIEKIETVIGPNTNFRGTLISDGSIRIDGVCEQGLIKTLGNIIVGPEAKVAADMEAENISVSGAVTGRILASGRLEILRTGKVWGDVEVGSFLLDEEGYFRGNLAMKDEPEPPDFGLIPALTEPEALPLESETGEPEPFIEGEDVSEPKPPAEPVAPKKQE